VQGCQTPVVAELGGGYGGMAYYLLRDNPNVTYIDFDLPENMALTAYFLINSFPNKKIALYGEVEINSETIRNYDGVILPNFMTHEFADNSTDLIFNSYSLAEMSENTISKYISEFTRISRNYILHVNHNERSVVKADDFKIEDNGFSLLYKIPALWNLVRDAEMDEFEYLYKKER
jgi:putative sugar O-methyltransferase